MPSTSSPLGTTAAGADGSAGGSPGPYVAGDGDGNDTLAPRQCGRCRKLFEGDPTLPPAALQEWWACPPCRLALLGR
jgi:hypothetical protein